MTHLSCVRVKTLIRAPNIFTKRFRRPLNFNLTLIPS